MNSMRPASQRRNEYLMPMPKGVVNSHSFAAEAVGRAVIVLRIADAEPPIGTQIRVAPGVIHEAVIPTHVAVADRRAGRSGGVVELRRGVGVLEFAAPVVVPVPAEEQAADHVDVARHGIGGPVGEPHRAERRTQVVRTVEPTAAHQRFAPADVAAVGVRMAEAEPRHAGAIGVRRRRRAFVRVVERAGLRGAAFLLHDVGQALLSGVFVGRAESCADLRAESTSPFGLGGTSP